MFELQKLGIVAYDEAWNRQKEYVQKIDKGYIMNQLLLLEHAHTMTLGRGSHQENLLFSQEEYRAKGIDFVEIDRGGDVTYHGPGQLVGYPIFFLGDEMSPHQYLRKLEDVLIDTLKCWEIEATRKDPYTGVWVEDRKIAAIGVKFNRGRIRRGYITSHGFALNVNTDLRYFDTIVPCGIQEHGVTSMERVLGREIDMDEVVQEIVRAMKDHFSNLTKG